ncbi:DgyrCDS10606 [Dimorphilus gyrociliatus]|uniref:Peroxisomal membrane protein PEX13 n=1 Tax=Dimorphilus gyrociliatus TaxID=2664684 RepID=A0A7I8W1X4_9ANNE|nr:DgyrCDS10606 [Dimorphilus gyrociliatus]
MSAPPKPWEGSAPTMENSYNPISSNGLLSQTPSQAPPVPVRNQQGSYSSYNSPYSSPYSSPYMSGGMGLSPYSSYSPYSSIGGAYGGYGGYRNYGQGGYPQSNFVRQAEASSRNAFQSIESVVSAFSSISMMLESTYSALYNSFRAVLGVAGHLTHVKDQLTAILSSIALFKTLRYLWRKLQVLLKLKPESTVEDVWKEVNIRKATGDGNGKSNWPIIMFFAIVMAGPWLIWKLLSSLGKNSESEWHLGKSPHFICQVNYDFEGRQEDEISVKQGEKLRVAPQEMQTVQNWLICATPSGKIGLVPQNYIKIIGKGRIEDETEVKPPSEENLNTAWKED